MTTWYSLSLGDGITAVDPSAEIQSLFLAEFTKAGSPFDMAIFTRNESEGRLHCEVIAYFSPAVHKVAEALDAQPCEKPARAELGLLVGEPRSWSVLFPEAGG